MTWGRGNNWGTESRAVASTTIASAAAISGAIDCGKRAPSKLVFDGYTAGAITFQVSRDGGTTFATLRDKDSVYTITDPGDQASAFELHLAPDVFHDVRIFKVVTANNQGAERAIDAHARRYQ